MRIAIYGSKRQEAYLTQIQAFLDSLARRADEVVMHTKLYDYLAGLIPAALQCVSTVTSDTDFTADVAVSLGGDGSFLRTAAWVERKGIPILGVNTGHLGFLASADISDLPTLADTLASGDYKVKPLSLIEVVAPRVEGWPYALNEVTITKSETSSIMSIRADIDNCPLADYRADGLIISTPTGSTAYNLSVGGPIVQSDAPVFVLSPIAAHSLSMRPLVVGDNSSMHFDCSSRTPKYRLSIDGHATVLSLDEPVELRKAPFSVMAVRLPGHTFASTLRDKLSWG
ncbi:MAG: NAD(+)/NADH kinase [Muribaculaceae bacterium]|nr:NAD(+)/NADH kinase [Muribaculaceae bacterium]